MNELCNHTSNGLRFKLSLLFFTISFQRKMFFEFITWNVIFLSLNQLTFLIFKKYQSHPKHVLQHTKFFNKKLNLIFMDHGGRLDKSSNLKFLKNTIFAQHNVKQWLETKFQWFLFDFVFPFWAIKRNGYLVRISSHKYKMKLKFG